jgi:hypothetical protein
MRKEKLDQVGCKFPRELPLPFCSVLWGEDRNVDAARTIEGGIGHDLPQEAPGAFADAMLKAGRV